LSSSDVDASGSLSSGSIIDDGSGVMEGTKSLVGVEVAGNRCSGTIIDDGSGVGEGTRSSTKVEVAGRLKAGSSDGIGWRLAQAESTADSFIRSESMLIADWRLSMNR